MPDPISQSAVVAVLLRLGYVVHAEVGEIVILIDPEHPASQLNFSFSGSAIEWEDLRKTLEYEGVDVARFLAELESLG